MTTNETSPESHPRCGTLVRLAGLAAGGNGGGHSARSLDESHVFSIIVLGASGDLATKKLLPALFNLHRGHYLPAKTLFCGYARSSMSREDFIAHIKDKLPSSATKEDLEGFFAHLYYLHGGYEAADLTSFSVGLSKIEDQMASSASPVCNRLFYMSLPPAAFLGAAEAIKHGALARKPGWTRLVVEKPFGRDLASAVSLRCALGELFKENQIFRIDHYLGKSMVMNLMALRFANIFLEPLWNKEHVNAVVITFKENVGTEGRAAYFDQNGIVRDVMQNHLMQLLALSAMDPPVSLDAEDIRDEKVRVLRCVAPLTRRNLILGQYEGYLDEPGVAKGSLTPTYAAACFHINNGRWSGVPFLMKCGKCLNERKAEIRVQFKHGLTNLFPESVQNELVIKIQPDESVYMKVMTQVPGMKTETTQAELDLSFRNRFKDVNVPEAYEYLLRDAVRGEQGLFVRADELETAWHIISPVLDDVEGNKVAPIIYKKGVRGVPEGDRLFEQAGYKYNPRYVWQSK